MNHRSEPRRLLVVDDDRAFRLSTCALLREEGYEVSDAADGQAAVQALRERRFDLLLLDLRMPGIHGLQLLESLRIWGHTLPVLLISGYGTVDVAVRALHSGADDFLTKPVEPDVLSHRVAELLDRRPSGGGGPSRRHGNRRALVGDPGGAREGRTRRPDRDHRPHLR